MRKKDLHAVAKWEVVCAERRISRRWNSFPFPRLFCPGENKRGFRPGGLLLHASSSQHKHKNNLVPWSGSGVRRAPKCIHFGWEPSSSPIERAGTGGVWMDAGGRVPPALRETTTTAPLQGLFLCNQGKGEAVSSWSLDCACVTLRSASCVAGGRHSWCIRLNRVLDEKTKSLRFSKLSVHFGFFHW